MSSLLLDAFFFDALLYAESARRAVELRSTCFSSLAVVITIITHTFNISLQFSLSRHSLLLKVAEQPAHSLLIPPRPTRAPVRPVRPTSAPTSDPASALPIVNDCYVVTGVSPETGQIRLQRIMFLNSRHHPIVAPPQYVVYMAGCNRPDNDSPLDPVPMVWVPFIATTPPPFIRKYP